MNRTNKKANWWSCVKKNLNTPEKTPSTSFFFFVRLWMYCVSVRCMCVYCQCANRIIFINKQTLNIDSHEESKGSNMIWKKLPIRYKVFSLFLSVSFCFSLSLYPLPLYACKEFVHRIVVQHIDTLKTALWKEFWTRKSRLVACCLTTTNLKSLWNYTQIMQ